MQSILGIIAVAIGFVGFAIYFRSIFKHNIKPHLFSWLIWGLSGGIVFVAQFLEGAGPGAWAMGANAIMCLTVAGIAVQHGEKNITKTDWWSLFSALGALSLWHWTKDPLLSVIILGIVDLVGIIPTVRKTWINPWQESMTFFVVDLIKFPLSIMAMEVLNLTTIIYPLAIMIASFTCASVIIIRRKVLHT